jgi:hypothetical protein
MIEHDPSARKGGRKFAVKANTYYTNKVYLKK